MFFGLQSPANRDHNPISNPAVVSFFYFVLLLLAGNTCRLVAKNNNNNNNNLKIETVRLLLPYGRAHSANPGPGELDRVWASLVLTRMSLGHTFSVNFVLVCAMRDGGCSTRWTLGGDGCAGLNKAVHA